jgi:hypothetical protein
MSKHIVVEEAILVFEGVKMNDLSALEQIGWNRDGAGFMYKALDRGGLWIDGYERGIFASYLYGDTTGVLRAVGSLYHDLEKLQIDVTCTKVDLNAKLDTSLKLMPLSETRGYSKPTREHGAIKICEDSETHIARRNDDVWISIYGSFFSYGQVETQLKRVYEDLAAIKLLPPPQQVGLAVA